MTTPMYILPGHQENLDHQDGQQPHDRGQSPSCTGTQMRDTAVAAATAGGGGGSSSGSGSAERRTRLSTKRAPTQQYTRKDSSAGAYNGRCMYRRSTVKTVCTAEVKWKGGVPAQYKGKGVDRRSKKERVPTRYKGGEYRRSAIERVPRATQGKGGKGTEYTEWSGWKGYRVSYTRNG